MAAALTRRRLEVTSDWAIICLFPVTVLLDAYTFADVIIVDINLDVAKESDFYGELNDFKVDLTAFKKAMKA